MATLIEVKTLHALARSICLEGKHPCRLTTSTTIINKALRLALKTCQKDPSFPIDYLDPEYAIQLIDRIKQREPYVLLDSPNRHDIQLCQAFDTNMKAMGFCTFQDLGPTAFSSGLGRQLGFLRQGAVSTGGSSIWYTSVETLG